MLKWQVVLLWLLAGGCLTGVNAAEIPVSLDNGEYQVPAVVNVPVAALPMPAVVLLHGTASHKDEVGDLYKRLAAALASAGIASVRIDFAGTGDSAVSYKHYTLNSAVRDARVALNYIRNHNSVDASRIGVVGFSQGGLIAQLLIADAPSIQSFVAWSSVANDGVGAFSPLFEQHYATAKQQGYATQQYSWRAPLDISIDWFEQIKQQRGLSGMADYKGALLAIAGSADEVVDPQAALRLIKASSASPAQAVIIKGASHIFNVLSTNAAEDEQLLTLTEQWFTQTL
ncbi:alpha/beta hydrolase [Alteromonas gilva]|uniref:Alpha/beta fold hydrolase n=1 Tax=Alteromonas gilva TaxID=2987522 RepID=A0ABT5L1B2_9ALTE|nr:alpha/beta fold hydrolase [Alteromonas gilva]MDC8830820.1 alpha/beta fold hydrolase [Alteromonas gilva]